jgi:hypothetical protein
MRPGHLHAKEPPFSVQKNSLPNNTTVFPISHLPIYTNHPPSPPLSQTHRPHHTQPSMDFRYSHPVPSSSYSSDGLAHGIPLRSHNDAPSESSGALRAQADWNACVAPVGSSQTPYQGGLGARFSFVAVTIPECVPERLEVVSYANEYAFLYDGELVCRSC